MRKQNEEIIRLTSFRFSKLKKIMLNKKLFKKILKLYYVMWLTKFVFYIYGCPLVKRQLSCHYISIKKWSISNISIYFEFASISFIKTAYSFMVTVTEAEISKVIIPSLYLIILLNDIALYIRNWCKIQLFYMNHLPILLQTISGSLITKQSPFLSSIIGCILITPYHLKF